jgi:hypothetical protein
MSIYSVRSKKNPRWHAGRIPTGSLWRRQSQQSFNTWTPFNFLFYSLHVSAATGHPQMRYIISYYLCFLKDYFNTTDPLHVCNLIIEMLFVVVFQLVVLIHVIELNIKKNKNCKISKIPRCCGAIIQINFQLPFTGNYVYWDWILSALYSCSEGPGVILDQEHRSHDWEVSYFLQFLQP